MKTATICLLVIIFCQLCPGQSVFERYKVSKNDDKPKIFVQYIHDYSGKESTPSVIFYDDITSIEEELVDSSEYTENIDKAIDAIDKGCKVFFFVDTYLWGGLENGTVTSGSWQREFPFCSGFYLFSNKSFEHQGLNFHIGTKDKKPRIRFYIMKPLCLKI
jgi:hypothetical protein